MGNKFTTSINILRDTESDFRYIKTPNSISIANQLLENYSLGLRSFNLIGSYGTGKSAFLLALEQTMLGNRRHFNIDFEGSPKVEFLKTVGCFESIISHFADLLNVTAKRNLNEFVLDEIFNKYHGIAKGKNKILCIVIDEFGKFLEYAAKNEPEKELYFVQQLAELCNNPKYNILFLTSVHQGFDSYAYDLSSSQKQEWTKVKGRFTELTFNEPIDQLLHLASEFISENISADISKRKIDQLAKIIFKSKVASINKEYLESISQRLYPLEPLSAFAVATSLQKYGQNERSLFSFLESADSTGLKKFDKRSNPFYNLSCVYDYLIYNYYSYLNSKYNIDFSHWSAIKGALEKVERGFTNHISDLSKIVKTIGILNIVSAKGANLDRSFLSTYCTLSCGIENSEELIAKLEEKKIILFREFSQSFILFEGSDLDIQRALQEAVNSVSEITNVSERLNQFFQFQAVLAKEVYYKKGTPRYFKYVLSDKPIQEVPEGEIDGFINLIFNDKLKEKDVLSMSEEQHEAILYAYFKNVSEIKKNLLEIEKVRKVLLEYHNDKVARKEMQGILDAHIRLLNYKIIGQLYAGGKDVKWFYKGARKTIRSKRKLNEMLSQISDDVYSKTPIFLNELVNRHKISTSIHTAKRKFFNALVDNWNEEDLGFLKDKFPPEKTIFLSLLKENGLSPYKEDASAITKPKRGSSFKALWDVSCQFLDSTKLDSRSLAEFVDLLGKRPFKLKQGVIDFWLSSFLFLKRDDFALFSEHGYIPHLTYENMILIVKKPSNYSIKSFNVDGVKLDLFNVFRTLIEKPQEWKISNDSFKETIRPFITFHKSLPPYTKGTKRLSKSAQRLLNVIETAKDPEETFFQLFPAALGWSVETGKNMDYKKFSIELQQVIREIRTCYDELLSRFESYIVDEYLERDASFLEYKEVFQKRFKSLESHMLVSKQKTFVDRINSKIDDRNAWLNSLSQVLIGKTMEHFTDEDEFIIKDAFSQMIMDLDSLVKLSKESVDLHKEHLIRFKLDSFDKVHRPHTLRLPVKKLKDINTLKKKIRKVLINEDAINLAALVTLIEEISENE